MRGKLEAGYYIKQTGQLENRPASWKLEIFWPDTQAGNYSEAGKFLKNIPF